jgi:cysteine desulfurase/selenocysteine lyase
LVAVGHVSNALGTLNPLHTLITQAHAQGIPVLVDGAQGAPHQPVDVQALDCDFYVFSGHKVYGPTGIGVLYAKAEWLAQMVPYQTGGDMIDTVTFEKTTFAPAPRRFEAGTPPIAEVLGLMEALNYVSTLGMSAIEAHEHMLLNALTPRLEAIPGLRIIGQAREKMGIVSFVMDAAHPHDIGTILDTEGIAIRAGHHCAQPVMQRFNVPATARISFGIYNTLDEIDILIAALHKVNAIFS